MKESITDRPFEDQAGCVYPACGPLYQRNCPPLPPKVRS